MTPQYLIHLELRVHSGTIGKKKLKRIELNELTF